MLRRRRFNIPAHDPRLGIDPINVVEKLDEANWHQRAVCRTDGDDHYYIYINQPLIDDDTPGPERYFIIVNTLYRNNDNGQKWKTHYQTLREALNYANGEDNSEFSKHTYPSPPPPKSGPKPKCGVAWAVQAAAKKFEKELKNEAGIKNRDKLTKEEKRELFDAVATKASADHPIYREGAMVTPLCKNRSTQSDRPNNRNKEEGDE